MITKVSRLVLAGSTGFLTAAAALLSATPAAASTAPATFFVAPAPADPASSVSDQVANTCTTPSKPCTSISRAIAEEASSRARGAPRAVISLANGVYDDAADLMFNALGPEIGRAHV